MPSDADISGQIRLRKQSLNAMAVVIMASPPSPKLLGGSASGREQGRAVAVPVECGCCPPASLCSSLHSELDISSLAVRAQSWFSRGRHIPVSTVYLLGGLHRAWWEPKVLEEHGGCSSPGGGRHPSAGEVLSPSALPLFCPWGRCECSSPCLWFVLPLMRREGTRADLIVGEKRGFWHRTECWAGLSAASNWIQVPE